MKVLRCLNVTTPFHPEHREAMSVRHRRSLYWSPDERKIAIQNELIRRSRMGICSVRALAREASDTSGD